MASSEPAIAAMKLAPQDNVAVALRRLAAGEYVHTHNVASDYLPTYTLPP